MNNVVNENRPTRRSDILVEGSLDEAMLYHPDSDELHVLNPTARFIWTLCDGDHSLDQMVDALRTHFAVSPDSDIQSDVEQTLAEFRTMQLLR